MESNLELVKQLAEERLQINDVDLTTSNSKVQLIALPRAMKILDLDNYLPFPRRISESIEVATLSSFVTYINYWKGENSLITAKRNNDWIAKCVVDYHDIGKPSHAEHSVILEKRYSTSWDYWRRGNKLRLSQRELIHFLEDGAEDIQSPDLAAIINEIRNIKVGKAGAASSSVSVTEESKSMEQSKKLYGSIPEYITIGIAPWTVSEKYEVKARLFVHADGSEIKLSYHLINIERILDDAFFSCVKIISDTTQSTVYV